MAIIQGHVLDPQGLPVAGATVYVSYAPISMPDVAQLTDALGKFTLLAPVPGHYKVGVRSDDWGLAQTDIKVGAEDAISVKVQFDPLEK